MNAPDLSAATLPALFPPHTPAALALADGTVLRGRAVGASGMTADASKPWASSAAVV